MNDNKHTSDYGNNSDNEKDNPVNPPVTSPEGKQKANKNESSEKSDNPPQNKENNSKNWWSKIELQDRIQIILTVINSIMLIAFIVFGWIQSKQTIKAVRKTDIANSVSQKALDYSKESVDLSRRVFLYTKQSDSINDLRITRDFIAREKATKMELRAYVGFHNIVDIEIKQGNPVRFNLEIVNTGKTPAYKVSVGGFSLIGSDKDIEKVISDLHKGKYLKGTVYLGASETFVFHHEAGTPDMRLDEKILRLGVSLDFICYITYYDIFGTKHYTQVYARFVPQTWAFKYNERYNGAD